MFLPDIKKIVDILFAIGVSLTTEDHNETIFLMTYSMSMIDSSLSLHCVFTLIQLNMWSLFYCHKKKDLTSP